MHHRKLVRFNLRIKAANPAHDTRSAGSGELLDELELDHTPHTNLRPRNATNNMARAQFVSSEFLKLEHTSTAHKPSPTSLSKCRWEFCRARGGGWEVLQCPKAAYAQLCTRQQRLQASPDDTQAKTCKPPSKLLLDIAHHMRQSAVKEGRHYFLEDFLDFGFGFSGTGSRVASTASPP